MLEVEDGDDKKCSECDLIVTNRIMNEDESSESEVQWRISCPGINCACCRPLDEKNEYSSGAHYYYFIIPVFTCAIF